MSVHQCVPNRSTPLAARAAIAVLLLGACASPEASPDVRVSVDSIAQQYVSAAPIVGLTVAVSRGGRVVHERGYGVSRRESDAPAEPDTPFELFSVGKMFTAALALRLAERGVLDLDADVATYVPDVPAPYAGTTIRQLLRHGSGTLEEPIDEVDPSPNARRPASHDALMAYLSRGQRVAEPDRRWMYNSQGFVLAGLAAAQAARASYAELVRNELTAPLGLNGLRYCPELNSVRAAGYLVRHGQTRPIVPVDFSWFGGAGSLCGSAGALVRWWDAVRTGRLLDTTALAQMMDPVPLMHDRARAGFDYGLGLRLGEYAGHRLMGHTGNGAGGTAVLLDFPDDSLIIAVATNTAGEGVPHAAEIGAAIAGSLLGVRIPDPATVPIPTTALAGAPGFYRSPEGEFCITAGREALLVADDGGDPVPLLHIGQGRFRRPGGEGIEEYFPGWPDDFAWFAYRFHGFPMDLAVRVGDRCQTGGSI